MDMTDLKRAPAASAEAVEDDTPEVQPDHWRDVFGEMSTEIAGPLSAALERVQTLATTGRIDRAGLHALSSQIQHVRQISMTGQQLTRLASGKLRQVHERLPLADTMKDVLTQRAQELDDRGVRIKQMLRPTEVIVDASLLFSLLDTLVTWTMDHARSTVDLRIDIKTWPTHARVTTKFAHRGPDQQNNDGAAPAPVLDTMTWRLLEQTAWTMGLVIERKLVEHEVVLTLEFPRTVNNQLEGASAIELDQGFSTSLHAKPLEGSQVLVVASRRDVRVQVRDAIRNMGLIVDFVNSVEEAREFCRGGLPHAIIVETVLRGDRFNDLRRDVESAGAEVAFIEIIEEGNTFEISGFGGLSMARVGRDAILTSLSSALMFELAKTV